MKNEGYEVQHLAQVPQGTSPRVAIDTAYALVVYCLQYPEVFPSDELKKLHNASVVINDVRETWRERADEAIRRQGIA